MHREGGGGEVHREGGGGEVHRNGGGGEVHREGGGGEDEEFGQREGVGRCTERESKLYLKLWHQLW